MGLFPDDNRWVAPVELDSSSIIPNPDRPGQGHIEVPDREPLIEAVDDELVEIELVPVEVFGADGCGLPDCKHCRDHSGYGLMDAVSAWSDCNRATGRIYRVEDLPGPRQPGDTIKVFIRKQDLPWLQKRHGDR